MGQSEGESLLPWLQGSSDESSEGSAISILREPVTMAPVPARARASILKKILSQLSPHVQIAITQPEQMHDGI